MASYRVKLRVREKDYPASRELELVFKAPLQLDMFAEKLFEAVKPYIPKLTRKFVMVLDVDYLRESDSSEAGNNGSGDTRKIQVANIGGS